MADSTNGATTTENGLVPMSPRYVMRNQIAGLISTFDEGWRQTPERSVESRALLNGDKQAPIPEEFKIAGADNMRVDTAHKYLEPYHQRNLLAKDVPRVKRWAMGDAITRQSEATRIENIIQSVMDEVYPWKASVDILLIDACGLVIVLPQTAAMSRTPSLFELDGKTVKSRYARNAQGKTKAEGGPDWRLSKKASSKVLEADKRDILSRQIPLQMEILGPTAFIPVFAPDYSLDAVVVQRYWTITELLRKRFLWDGMERHLSPAGPAGTHGEQQLATQTGNRLKVTELYAVDYDEEGIPHPYVAYMVDNNGDGQLTKASKITKDGREVDAIVDLYAEYGVQRLPVKLAWGPSFYTADADQRAMPFPLPFAQSWLAIDAILTGATVWAWWRGFPTLIEQPSTASPPEINTIDESPNDELEIKPMSIIRANGTVTELGTQGPSAIILELVQYLAGANREEGPPPAASGGGGESGFQASLARAYADDAMSDVRDGAIDLYKAAASFAFEILTGIAERWGPVPIQRITKVPLGARSQDGRAKREILDLTADLAGGLFDIDADFPPQPNLAKGQQWAEWVQLGLVLLEEFREEIIGDPNPEVFLARRLKQRIMDSPEMQQKIMALVAQLSGDEQERQQIAALAQQQAVKTANGQVLPASLGHGVPPPSGPPMALPGGPMVAGPTPTGMGPQGSIAQSAVAGAMGGQQAAIQNAAAAGGAVPANLPGIG